MLTLGCKGQKSPAGLGQIPAVLEHPVGARNRIKHPTFFNCGWKFKTLHLEKLCLLCFITKEFMGFVNSGIDKSNKKCIFNDEKDRHLYYF